MKKTLLSLSIALAGTAIATPYNSGDTKTFSMGGIGVSSADAGQSSVMNPALLATDLRRDLFAFEWDVFTIAPKVGGFGEIANDYLELDVVDRGTQIFSDLETEVNGSGGLIELGNSLVSTVGDFGFDASFDTNVSLAAPTSDPYTSTAAFRAELNTLQTNITTTQTNITTTNTELSDTSAGLTTVSDDAASVETKLNNIETNISAQLTSVTDDLLDWLENFNGKDAYIEASVSPISFALPDRQWGLGLHIDNYVQAGLTLNLTDDDTIYLNGAVDDATGLLNAASTNIGGVAGTLSDETAASGDIQTNTATLQTDLTALNTALGELQAEFDKIDYALGKIEGGAAPGDANDQPGTYGAGTTYQQIIDTAYAVINDGDPAVAGSVAKVNAAQSTITDDTTGSVDILLASVDAVTNLSTDVTTAVNSVNDYTGENEVIVNGEIDVTTDDFNSSIAVAVAGVQEVGVSLAREFNIQGQDVSFGVTPKLQIIVIEDYVVAINEAEEFETRTGVEPMFRVNVDLGAAKEWDFYGTVKAGMTIKNLIPYTLVSPNDVEVAMRPKARIGASHHTAFSTVGIDLDLTNNAPFYFGQKSREIALGGELSLWGHAAIRAGANWNISDPDETGVATFGLGLTPFGTGLNFAAWIPFDAFSADYGSVISDAIDGEYGSALTTGDQLLRDFGLSANLQIAW